MVRYVVGRMLGLPHCQGILEDVDVGNGSFLNGVCDHRGG